MDSMQIINAIRLSYVAFVLYWIATGSTLAQAQPFAYVTNVGSNTASVIDTATNTVVATVPVGIAPFGVAVTPNGAFAYVTNFLSHTVSVIDTATNSVVATVPVSITPFGVAVTPNGAFAYVTNANADIVSVIHTATNTVVAIVPVGAGATPIAVVITPNGAFAYVANQSSGTVSVIDTATNSVVATVPVGMNLFGVAIVGPDASMEPSLVFLHGSGANANPAVLFLDSVAPTNSTAKYRDSAAIKFSGGNPWKAIGTWVADPTFTSGTLNVLGDLNVWLGLKNSDDQGTRFDLAAEVWKNGTTLVAEGETLCVTGVTRNPSLAKEVTVSFQPFSPVTFDGSTDVLSLKLLTRIGTNGSGGFCGGHSNATGLRLYFDAVDRDAGFSANPN
jgi:YVTN family beta-propeller protein